MMKLLIIIITFFLRVDYYHAFYSGVRSILSNQPRKCVVMTELSHQELQEKTTFYNTLSRRKEKFIPNVKNQVSFYSCGPTVYDYAHIGNFRAFLTYDIIKRWLEYCGYEVNHICNLTDVDDKIIIKMTQEGKSLQEITTKYAQAFFQDLEMLNIKKANHYPKATEYIQKMTEIISQLLRDGYAYEENGSIYFNVKKSKQYGQLALLEEEQLEEQMVAGAGDSGPNERRGESDKRDPRDFALWKAFVAQDGDVKWQTEIGEGRPGWHIECSAMCHSLLGDEIDIHGGGIDLVFPHHTNEIAQTEAYTGKKFCNYWIHNGFVNINNEKMSKSLKNFKTLRDIVNTDFDARAFRYLVITSQYRNPLNFNEETFLSAKNSLKRIDKVINRSKEIIAAVAAVAVALDGGSQENVIASSLNTEILEIQQKIEQYQREIELFVSDDLNTPRAIASYFQMISMIEKYLSQHFSSIESPSTVPASSQLLKPLQKFLQTIQSLDNIFGFLDRNKVGLSNNQHPDGCNCSNEKIAESEETQQIAYQQVKTLAQQRYELKQQKKYQESDQLRQKILELGYVIKDKKDGYDILKKE